MSWCEIKIRRNLLSLIWWRRERGNPHSLAGAATSRLRVCQFRHFRFLAPQASASADDENPIGRKRWESRSRQADARGNRSTKADGTAWTTMVYVQRIRYQTRCQPANGEAALPGRKAFLLAFGLGSGKNAVLRPTWNQWLSEAQIVIVDQNAMLTNLEGRVKLLIFSNLVSRAGLEPATTALKVQIGHLSLHPDALFSVTYGLNKGHREPTKDKKVAKSDAKSKWLCGVPFSSTKQHSSAREKCSRSQPKDRGVKSTFRDDANFQTSRRDSRIECLHFNRRRGLVSRALRLRCSELRRRPAPSEVHRPARKVLLPFRSCRPAWETRETVESR